MDWLDELQPASFRGAIFRVATSRSAFGRRNVVHEYPLRDHPFAEDLGRRARSIKITGFVLGGGAIAQRDALIAACEAEGPGALVHPSLGEIEVVCNSIDIEETEQGRIFRFVMDLSEAGSRAEPRSSADSRAGVLDMINAELDAVSEGLNVALKIAGLPEYVIAEAAGVLSRAASIIQSIRPRSILSGVTSRLDSLLAILRDKPVDAITSGIAVRTVFDAIDALGAESDPRVISERAGEVVSFDLPETPEPQAAALISVLHAAVQTAALTEIARSTTSVTFTSQQDAEGHRDYVRDLFDVGLDAAAARFDDPSFDYLNRLSAASLTDVAERGASLAPMMPWRQARALPSVVAAWRLYQDPARDGEISGYLSARHPLFLPVDGLVLAR